MNAEKENPTGIVFHNQRPGNKRSLRQIISSTIFQNSDDPRLEALTLSIESLPVIKSVSELKETPQKELEGIGFVVVAGGDGSVGLTENHFNANTVRVLLPAGSANTLSHGLSENTNKEVEIPEELKAIFPPHLFKCIEYCPPGITCRNPQEELDNGKEEITAYMLGADHMSTFCTKIKEELTEKYPWIDPNLAYIVAGLASIFALKNRVEPCNITYYIEDEEIQIKNDKKIAAHIISTIPRFGTFHSKAPLEPDKLRVFDVSANSEIGLFLKYAGAVLIGGLLGLDRAINAKLINCTDVDSVSLTPDNNHKVNCNMDGKQNTRSGKLTIERVEEPRHYVIPLSTESVL